MARHVAVGPCGDVFARSEVSLCPTWLPCHESEQRSRMRKRRYKVTVAFAYLFSLVCFCAPRKMNPNRSLLADCEFWDWSVVTTRLHIAGLKLIKAVQEALFQFCVRLNPVSAADYKLCCGGLPVRVFGANF